MTYPLLIIDIDVAGAEKKLSDCGLVVYRVDGLDGLKRLVRDFKGLALERPVVISDVASVRGWHNILLKFIEESQSPLIFVSSTDSLPGVLMSRFMGVYKTPRVLENHGNSHRVLADLFDENGDFVGDGVERLVGGYPEFLQEYMILRRGEVPSSHKVLRMVAQGSA